MPHDSPIGAIAFLPAVRLDRHKDQLRIRCDESTFPIIWAEAVSADGAIHLSGRKTGHVRIFTSKRGDEWLKAHVPFGAYDAKEQARRLIAAGDASKFSLKARSGYSQKIIST